MAVGDLQLSSTVYAKNGRDRLQLFDIVETEDGASNFHSVVWERRFGAEWRNHHTLSQQDIQWQYPNRRWVSEIHSFAPERATAILKMAEGNKPMYPLVLGQATTFYYSWREWHLLENRELKRLMDCESPFDPCPKVSDES